MNDNREKIVALLLEEDFKENQLDIRNNTPVSYAIENNFQKIIELFPSQQNNLEETYTSEFTNFEIIFERLQKGERFVCS